MTTPMQKLKNQFDELKTLLPKEFKEVSLNKSEDRIYVDYFCGDRFVHEIKGVKSDFIKTFKIQLNDIDSYSLGFSFNYLDVSEHSVIVSLKKGNKEPSFLNSKSLNIDDFKISFKKSINDIKLLEEKTHLNIIEVFKKEFELAGADFSKKRKKKIR